MLQRGGSWDDVVDFLILGHSCWRAELSLASGPRRLIGRFGRPTHKTPHAQNTRSLIEEVESIASSQSILGALDIEETKRK